MWTRLLCTLKNSILINDLDIDAQVLVNSSQLNPNPNLVGHALTLVPGQVLQPT